MVKRRQPEPVVDFIGEYWRYNENLFSDVQGLKAFKHLHMGMISETKCKILPAIAKVVGLDNYQSLHHFF